MDQRSRSYPQAYMPYGQSAVYGNGQQQGLSNGLQQQYRQYPGSDNSQSPNTATASNNFPDWDQQFQGQGLSFQQTLPQNSRNQSAVSQELDLGAFSADPQSVENIALDSLTTSATEGWRPPGFPQYPQFRETTSALPNPAHARTNGVVSEPLPNEQKTIELSSNSSSVVDSAYLTANPGEEAGGYNGYPLANDHPNDHFQTARALSRSASSYGQSTSNHRVLSSLHPQRAFDNRRRKSSEPLPPCQFCGELPKNKSDGQKHENRHTKPFKCNFPECMTKGIGFATSNDLDRHYKSGKHNLAPTKGSGKGYICAACQFAPDSRPKWWPRLDNFKAHIARRHKHIDVLYLIKASERDYRPVDIYENTSTYFAGSSIADQDYYQHQDLPSSSGTGQLPNQGEALSWPDQHATLPSIDEVLAVGVGEAQHLADLDAARPSALAGADRPYGDELAGLSLLGAAAEMTSPTSRPEVPIFRVTQHDGDTPKRASADEWEQGQDKRQRGTWSSQKIQDTSEAEGPLHCSECGKMKKRRCDLRKHEKRHNRPYGCTFPRCYFRQGSRSDWKRHEDRQHRVHEAWKCTLHLSGKPCHNNYNSRKDFMGHLQDDHHIPCEKITQQYCDNFQLGRDGHFRFWCGFCNAVTPNDNPAGSRTARDKMFDHIGDHFDKEGRNIQEYICQELKRPFGDLNRESKRKAKAEYNFKFVERKGAFPSAKDLPSSVVSGQGLDDSLFS